ncbi:MAG TPA: dephospho-CoA kinase [Bacillota bacterium]|nr:dephospho-CoA kinase [Bacillota bacterium]
MVLGLTGGIACGKSTVAKMLEDLGCVVVDADKVAREVVTPGEQGLELVVKRFGRGILDEAGELNRKALGELVFSDVQARQDLNDILHPLIRSRMDEKKEAAKRLKPPLIIMDIPLLFESKRTNTVEAVIVIYVPEDIQLLRLITRDGLSREEALARMKSQMDIEEKKKLADFVIDNSQSEEITKQQVRQLFMKLTKET